MIPWLLSLDPRPGVHEVIYLGIICQGVTCLVLAIISTHRIIRPVGVININRISGFFGNRYGANPVMVLGSKAP